MVDYVYDIETYPNVFTMGVSQVGSLHQTMFEISERQEDSLALIDFLRMAEQTNARMIGFNNMGFDYPILHHFQNSIYSMDNIAFQLWEKAQSIIDSDDRFAHVIWRPNITQIDLYKINHFDNIARATSLKMLEFNMRMDAIEELPFQPGAPVPVDQIHKLIEYNWHDVYATEQFLEESHDLIEFREELSQRYNHDFMNYNDTKIGKQYFIMELERLNPGSCYTYDENNRRQIRQTRRGTIALDDVIFPYVQFQHQELQRVLTWLKQQTVTNAHALKDVSASIDGFTFDFGSGGIHGSINDSIVIADLDHAIIDLDVTSYYPSLAIANGIYPEHLGEGFCAIYADIKAQRAQHPKGSAPNKMLKLALNGVYGDTGNVYSPFLDMKYLLSITINGQLLLCMLAEHVMRIPGLQMIQINTDGLTVKVRRDQLDQLKAITDWWQSYTLLELEEVEYSRMFIRDVNNYIGEYMDGKLKRKGAYEHVPPGERNPSGWHQNLSAMVVPKAAEAFLVHGTPLEQFIYHHADIMDFMLRTKVPRASTLEIDGVRHQNITRYLVTHKGGSMVKISPPPDGYVSGQWKRANGLTDAFYYQCLAEGTGRAVDKIVDSLGKNWDERINTKNKSVYGERRLGISAGFLVTPYNTIDFPIDRGEINMGYYIQEAEKLVSALKVST